MSFASALWFLLLHATAGTAVPAVHAEHRASSLAISCPFADEAHSIIGQRHALATPQQLPSESLRASYAAPITALARPSWRSPATAVPVLHACEHSAQLALGFTAISVLRRLDNADHRSARDARFVSYFPTAPPLA